jgi:hypothetical protein
MINLKNVLDEELETGKKFLSRWHWALTAHLKKNKR